MAVYKPKNNGAESKFYTYEFVYQRKRFRGSTKATTKTLAKEIERQRKAELERAAAGLPTKERKQRIRTVAEVIKPYLKDYKLSHQPKSILFATGWRRLKRNSARLFSRTSPNPASVITCESGKKMASADARSTWKWVS